HRSPPPRRRSGRLLSRASAIVARLQSLARSQTGAHGTGFHDEGRLRQCLDHRPTGPTKKSAEYHALATRGGGGESKKFARRHLLPEAGRAAGSDARQSVGVAAAGIALRSVSRSLGRGDRHRTGGDQRSGVSQPRGADLSGGWAANSGETALKLSDQP